MKVGLFEGKHLMKNFESVVRTHFGISDIQEQPTFELTQNEVTGDVEMTPVV